MSRVNTTKSPTRRGVGRPASITPGSAPTLVSNHGTGALKLDLMTESTDLDVSLSLYIALVLSGLTPRERKEAAKAMLAGERAAAQ